MAVSHRSTSSWVYTASGSSLSAPSMPTHQAGDMILIRIASKSATATSHTIGQPANWTRVGTVFNGAGTNSGNGIGSVVLTEFYKEATSSSETVPSLSTSGGNTTQAGVCIIVYQKGAGETWEAPVGDGGEDTTADTSKSVTIQSHVTVAAGDMVDFFIGIRDDCTVTVPTITQSGVTFDTVSEQPATAGTDTSGADGAYDGGYRLATAGTSSAAAVVTATLSTNETGSAWMTRLRASTSAVNGSFTADAIVRKTQSASVTADAIARRLNQPGSFIADAVIRKTRTFARNYYDTFTRTVVPGIGTSDSGHTYVLNEGDQGATENGFYTIPALGAATWLLPECANRGQVQYDFLVPSDVTTGPAIELNFSSPTLTTGGLYASLDAGSTWIVGIGIAEEISYTFTPTPGWYTAKARYDLIAATASIKVWRTGTAEPDWQDSGSITVTPGVGQPSISMQGSSTAAASIDNTSIDSGLLVDAVIRKTQPSSFTADAIVRRLNQPGSLTADAVVRHTYEPYRAAVLADGSIAYWRHGESSGTDAFAEVGPDGTYVNTPTLGAASLLDGDPDTAVTFDADSDEYMQVLSGMPAGSETGAGIEAVIEFDSLVSGRLYTIARWGPQSTTVGFHWLYYDVAAGELRWQYCNGTDYVIVGASWTPSIGVVYHVLVTHDYVAGTVTRYIDGMTLAGTDTGQTTVEAVPANAVTYIAAYGSGSGQAFDFDGTVDDPAIYDYALSAAQAVHHGSLAKHGIAGITVDAVIAPGATTVPGDFTADAVIFRTQPGSLAVDAVLRRLDQPGTFTADAILRRAQAGALTADAVVLRTQIGSLTADAVLRRPNQSGSFTADAVINRTQPGSLTADALISQTQATSFTVDAVIRGTPSGSFTADAIKLKTMPPASVSADAVLLRTQVGSFTADAIVSRLTTAAVSVDAVVLRTQAGSTTADAVLFKTQTASATIDATIFRTQVGSFTADAIALRPTTSTFSGDAIVQAIQSASLAADAVVLRVQSETLTANAWVAGSGVFGFPADAVLFRTISASFVADAALSQTTSAAFTADASLSAESTGNFTANAVLNRTITGTFSTDAVIRATISASYTADAVQKKTQSASFLGDSTLLAGRTGGLTSDAVLLSPQSSTFTADAWVLGSGVSAFTADAVLYRTLSASYDADAVLRSTSSASFTADAFFSAAVGGSFTADAITFRTILGSFSSDSVFEQTIQGQLDAEAILRVVHSNPLTVDAALARTVVLTVSANAVIFNPNALQFTVNAWVKTLHPQFISAELTAASIGAAIATTTISAEVGASTISAEITGEP